MNRDVVIAGVGWFALVYGLGVLLFWQDAAAAAVLIALAGLAWLLRREAARQRRRDAEFDRWIASPEARAQFIRDALGDGQPGEGVQSSGPGVDCPWGGPETYRHLPGCEIR